MHALVAHLRQQGRTVETQSITRDGQSWVVLVRRFAPTTSSEFDALWAQHPANQPKGKWWGKETTFPRWVQAYGHDYAFTGHVAKHVPFSGRVGALLEEVQKFDPRLNAALLNYYDASLDHRIGPHSDNVDTLVPDSPIASLSVCSPGHR